MKTKWGCCKNAVCGYEETNTDIIRAENLRQSLLS